MGDGLCAEEGVGAADIDGVADGDFAVGDAEDGRPTPTLTGPPPAPPTKGESRGYANNDGVVGLYALYGGVVVAVSGVVAVGVGEGSGGFAGGEKGD